MTTSPIRTAAPDGVDALTADGGIVRMRPVRPDDGPALAALFGRATANSLRLRFFAAPNAAMIAAEVDRLCRMPTPRTGAVLAELAGTVVGVAAYERTTVTDPRAEFAVFVDEPERGRGIATLLLEHLAVQAHRNGVAELVGEVLPGNARMLRVAHELTARFWSRFDDGIVDVALRTGVDEAAQQAMDVRDRRAERASLRPLLAPASVAVIGAGWHPGDLDYETLRALREYGCRGRLVAVDPRAGASDRAEDRYPSLAQLPGPVDLAIIAGPPDVAEDVLVHAPPATVRGVVVLGFGTGGEPDRAADAQLVRLARDHGIRVVGPNSLGIINTDPAVRLDASVVTAPPPPGGLAVATQSGAVGLAVLDQAVRSGCGVSTFVSLGDKADVSGNDLIAYWFDDPHTTAVALHLGSFGNPRKFARTVRALARRKPVLAVRRDQSGDAPRSGASRSAAADQAPVDALFAQAGVVQTADAGELVDAARMLTGQPLPAGDRLAVIGGGGTLDVLAAEAAEAAGLRVPALSPALRARLAAVAGRPGELDNPINLGVRASGEALAALVGELATSREVDSLLVVMAGTRANDVLSAMAALGSAIDRHPELPSAVVVVGVPGPPVLGTRRVPVFDLPERAVRALGRATRYAEWRRQPLGAPRYLPDIDVAAARAVVDEALGADEGWQPPERVARLLGAYRIRLVGGVPDREGRAPVRIAAGVVHDPLFGSLVLASSESSEDPVYRLVPMTDRDATRMWRSLGRAAPAADPAGASGAAVEELLLRLGRLAEDLPEVAELRLDPVLVGLGGAIVADARLRLHRTGAEPDPWLRRLRQPD